MHGHLADARAWPRIDMTRCRRCSRPAGGGDRADLCRALAPHRYVLAPVQAAGAVAGLVLLMASDGWPAEAATETVAHAAVAIGRLVEQGAGTVPSLHDAESGLYAAPALARLGAQELERAARYHRPLSLAVFAVTGSHRRHRSPGADRDRRHAPAGPRRPARGRPTRRRAAGQAPRRCERLRPSCVRERGQGHRRYPRRCRRLPG
ncbi:MAG: hypothetical protein U0531_14365 [Dehalococcoidia bacterium]